MSARAAAAFFGHGSPMNALERNAYTRAWAAAGQAFPKPQAILAVSAHWYVRGTAVTAMARPPTIHDFGGFPPALHAVQYPAPGDPALASRVKELLSPLPVALDGEWGLDHGTWSVLAHVYPEADVPVVQLAIDATRPPRFHYELGRRLAPLRDEGVLLFASGNVVHNLGVIRWGAHVQAHPWATRFSEEARTMIEKREHDKLVDYTSMGEAARLSVPTPDHYLPLLYVLGAQRDDDALGVITDGIELGSIGMLSFAVSRRDDHVPAG